MIELILEPKISILAEPTFSRGGIEFMVDDLKRRYPDTGDVDLDIMMDAETTDAETLTEIMGRLCYASFGKRASGKSNAEYIQHTQSGQIAHKSIMYHAHFSFYFSGISRRWANELIRHHVGCHGEHEGSPSAESSRFCLIPGSYVAPVGILKNETMLSGYQLDMNLAHEQYIAMVEKMTSKFISETGSNPRGMDKKRILEAAAGLLPSSVETHMGWTANASALVKMILERSDYSADLEARRFVRLLAEKLYSHSPNLFFQLHNLVVSQ